MEKSTCEGGEGREVSDVVCSFALQLVRGLGDGKVVLVVELEVSMTKRTPISRGLARMNPRADVERVQAVPVSVRTDHLIWTSLAWCPCLVIKRRYI